MTSFLVPFLLIVLNLNPNTAMRSINQFNLPKTWNKELTISYSFSGSMDGSRTQIIFTYDSCKYTIQPGMKAPKTGAFAMTEAGRAEILKKMQELKVNKIKSDMSIGAVDDGWSESLLIGSHWIEGGTSAKMNDKDKETFSTACVYLQDFVAKKGKHR
ncbi:hypothetical protein A3860_29150 [Niastella vici]|uniref:Uncharacterized protein n=1 Tax=Niastella vici TaxID=1703345 RepID=A0A1V9FVS6_9BACT|nr:hypothetical protein [Niastella vici]OQP62427.1 hypothetical protein A3860_29150 [Niastella vici]